MLRVLSFSTLLFLLTQFSFAQTDSILTFEGNPEITEIPSTPVGENASDDYRFIWRMPKKSRTGKVHFNTATGYHSLELPEYPEYKIPILSLVLDSIDLFGHDAGLFVPGSSFDPTNPIYSGNYQRRGKEWERKCSLSYYENGQLVFKSNVGLRTHGLLARSSPQKSLRLCAREEIDLNKLDFDFFDNSAFAKYLIVRSPFSSHANNLLADAVVHHAAMNTHLHAIPFQPVACYINGVYWGQFNLRERPDEYFYARMEGCKKNEISFDKHFEDSLLVALVEGIESGKEWDWVAQRIDLENFIDYMIFETYFRNLDWGGNNNVQFYHTPTHQLKLALIDLDATFQVEDENTFTHLHNQKDVLSTIWSYLKANDSFCKRFADRYIQLQQSHLNTERLTSILDSLSYLIEDELPHQVDRWNYPIDEYAFSDAVYDSKIFINARPHYFALHLNQELGNDYVDVPDIPSNLGLKFQQASESKWLHLLIIAAFIGLLYAASRMKKSPKES